MRSDDILGSLDVDTPKSKIQVTKISEFAEVQKVVGPLIRVQGRVSIALDTESALVFDNGFSNYVVFCDKDKNGNNVLRYEINATRQISVVVVQAKEINVEFGN